MEQSIDTLSASAESADASAAAVSSTEPEVKEEDVPESESPVSIETTRDVRSRRRRRVTGRIRQRKASPEEIPTAPETSAISAEPEPLSSPSPVVSEDPSGRPIGWVSTSQTIPALIEEGKLGRAESLLIDILSKNPRDTDAYKLLGTVYLKRGEISQAQEVFEEALRRDPDNAAIPGLLGETYFSRGEYSKALPMYQKAHSADEQNIEYLEKLLAIFTRTDRRPMVRVTAKKILAINPQHPEAKKLLERVGAR
jgi:Flp pilus assembly protein TadD